MSTLNTWTPFTDTEGLNQDGEPYSIHLELEGSTDYSGATFDLTHEQGWRLQQVTDNFVVLYNVNEQTYTMYPLRAVRQIQVNTHG